MTKGIAVKKNLDSTNVYPRVLNNMQGHYNNAGNKGSIFQKQQLRYFLKSSLHLSSRCTRKLVNEDTPDFFMHVTSIIRIYTRAFKVKFFPMWLCCLIPVMFLQPNLTNQFSVFSCKVFSTFHRIIKGFLFISWYCFQTLPMKDKSKSYFKMIYSLSIEFSLCRT